MPNPNPIKMAISLSKLILCPSDDSKIMVVETWKNIPTAVAKSQESDTEETSKTHCPKRIPKGAVKAKISK